MTATEPAPSAPSSELPHWDLTPFFPSIGSREFAVAHEEVTGEIGRLQVRFDELGIRGGDPLHTTDAVVAAVDEVVPAFNRLLAQMRLVGSYLYAHTTTDARDDEASGAQSRYQADTAPFATLDTRFDAWLARLDLAELTARSTEAADHAYALRRAATSAEHLMSEAEEDLASELALTGGRAWAKLHGDLTSRLTATVRRPGADPEVLPMSVVRGLAATGRVISCAAAIMVAVFMGFASESDPVVKQLGLGMGVAVALDATVVRMVLVPATMSLLGDLNWWMPRWLDRLLPTIRHEDHGPVDEPEPELVRV